MKCNFNKGLLTYYVSRERGGDSLRAMPIYKRFLYYKRNTQETVQYKASSSPLATLENFYIELSCRLSPSPSPSPSPSSPSPSSSPLAALVNCGALLSRIELPTLAMFSTPLAAAAALYITFHFSIAFSMFSLFNIFSMFSTFTMVSANSSARSSLPNNGCRIRF